MIKHWINGREVESPETFDNINPATGEVIGFTFDTVVDLLRQQFFTDIGVLA